MVCTVSARGLSRPRVKNNWAGEVRCLNRVQSGDYGQRINQNDSDGSIYNLDSPSSIHASLQPGFSLRPGCPQNIIFLNLIDFLTNQFGIPEHRSFAYLMMSSVHAESSTRVCFGRRLRPKSVSERRYLSSERLARTGRLSV